MATHRYWRLRATVDCGNGNENYCAVGTLQLRTSIGGSDVASGGTPSADSTLGGFPASNAFDGNNSTSWISGSGAYPHWIKYDFGAGNEKDIVEFAVAGRLDSGSTYAYQSPRDFTLDYSDDDSAWTTLFTVTGASDLCGGLQVFNADTRYDAGASGTVWRIYATAVGGGTTFALKEIEMRASAGGADQCTGGVGLADSTYQANTTLLAFDNVTTSASFWAAHTYSPLPSWIAYKFTSAVSVAELVMRARDSGLQNQAPTAFELQKWNGSGWDTMLTQSGLSWSADETKTFSVTVPSTARPVCFVAT